MKLKPWRSVIDPREDLRQGRSLDMAEFAVHLDQVHDRRGNELYWNPEQFFARTFLTKNLLEFAAEAVRRLSGVTASTSAGFNMTTQFGGGKTHALTLLYHLANGGPAAANWFGVSKILDKADIPSIPKAATAVFVGMRFDPRGGDDGTPRRHTPWGEIAWQLGDAEGYAVMAEADQAERAPGGDTLARLFDVVDRPILILMDEIINYMSRYRSSGLGGQMYNFIHTLSEEARSQDNVVLAIAVPASEIEMTADDWADYNRLMTLLNRLAKAEMVSSETDVAEIIRRRLFEWDENALDREGRVMLPRDAVATCNAYAAWVQENRQLLPGWFSFDHAAEIFKSTYPFHPALLSVFERKWQTLPNFQRTRGILRLLAIWVSKAHHEAYQQAHNDPLIGLGSAPLDDPMFRAAVFKQMNEDRLETPVTTDICGRNDSHAVRLDDEANSAIRKARLHRQSATAIFFESNGGMGDTHAYATVPEIRLDVGRPGLDIGNVETVLEALAPPDGACYYLDVVTNRYWFSVKANLTQVLADRKAAVSAHPLINEYVRQEIQKQFGRASGVNTIFFPTESNRIPNQPAISVVVLPPEQSLHDQHSTLDLIETWTRNAGNSARTFKSALIWAVADSPTRLHDAAQKLLAWESIWDDQDTLQLGDTQLEQLRRNRDRAQLDLKEAVWQSYGKVYLLGQDNKLRSHDIGPTNSSAADSLLALIMRDLRSYDEVSDYISPNFLFRNWPPAFVEWSTRAVRDTIYASPQFPRLLDANSLRETVVRGVANSILAYVGKTEDGSYTPFYFNQPLDIVDVEITDDMYIITAETAEAYLAAQVIDEPPEPLTETETASSFGETTEPYDSDQGVTTDVASDPEEAETTSSDPFSATTSPTTLTWDGSIPAQKWVNFFMKVLTKFASDDDLELRVNVRITNSEGISDHKVEEMKAALRELGLEGNVSRE